MASRSVPLPDSPVGGGLNVLLTQRHSVRSYSRDGLDLAAIAGAVVAVAGSFGSGRHATPSARASYPLAVSVVAGRVDGLPTGVYRYDAAHHALDLVATGDHRVDLAEATLDAGEWLPHSPAVLLLTADLVAARSRFPDQPAEHGERFLWMEVGCAAQNAYLRAAEHGLGTALIAGLDDAEMRVNTRGFVATGHSVLALLPLGHPAASARSLGR